MQGMIKNLGRFTVIISLIFGATSCSFQDPEVTSFDGIEILEIEDNTAEVDINITLNNPNGHNLKLKKAEFDVLINNIYFGKATLIDPVELPKKGEYPVKLHMSMEMDKTIAEMAVAVGIAALMNNINLKVRGEASGSMGWFKSKFEVDHSEKVDWNQFQDMLN